MRKIAFGLALGFILSTLCYIAPVTWAKSAEQQIVALFNSITIKVHGKTVEADNW